MYTETRLELSASGGDVIHGSPDLRDFDRFAPLSPTLLVL